MTQTIKNELEKITPGEPTHFGSLTIFPIFESGARQAEPDYVLLDEAIAQGMARVTELGASGTVPELRFENLGEKPVLLLDGEELLGAKQNRAINLTILAPAKQVIAIPVSCVEAGRWHMKSEDFRPAAHFFYSRGRASRAAQVTASMAASGLRLSDQGAVWADIAAKMERLGAESPTAAMSAIYEAQAASVDAYVRAFHWTEGQVGMVFAIGANEFGLDLLDRPDSMRKVFPKLLRSYALDAVELPRSATVGKAQVDDFLVHVTRTAAMEHRAIGLGKDVRLTGGRVSGAGLWAEQHFLHLCAFTTNGGSAPTGFRSRMSRPTRRWYR